jgi:hypothetical protein
VNGSASGGIIPVSPTGSVWLAILDVFYYVSIVKIRFWVKGENLSGGSETSLLDFAVPGERIVEQVAGGRGHILAFSPHPVR